MGKRLSFMVVSLGMLCWSLNLKAEPLVPALYIFGDSSLDVGTNHFIPETQSRADFKPYGIDFPNGEVTGRFSNGYNLADEIAMLLGFKMSPPPFLSLVQRQNSTKHFRRQILNGINFASGGSGLLHETGQKRYNRVISLEEQIQQFATVRRNISVHLKSTADARIKKSIFLFSIGSNDFFDLYFFNNYTVTETMRQQKLHEKLKNYGARKLAVLSISPLGCLPRYRLNPTECNKELNTISFAFYTTLKGILQNLTLQFPEIKYSLGNSPFLSCFTMIFPQVIGFENSTSPCCGDLTRFVSCHPDSKVCGNRTAFFFWDQVHPTQAVCELAASKFFSGDSLHVSPINLSELVRAS
ncbi:hypothetical protein L6164_027511 [Bauhinia variegata]|uniref:Uncharacterized protein n=1 Tax=Bauhinia variegata TaxID=167791 RepID=A0ACB9LTM6_BAUVA|nr:hypothetical protein L6164_027511 [Bauhinia variegata]